MRYTISLDPEGAEKLAKGELPYSWQFTLSVSEAGHQIGDNQILIAEGVMKMPTQETAAEKAISKLQQDIKDTRAEAYRKVCDLESRINDLSLLSYTPTEAVDE